jgi:hypothetical protein
VERLVKYVHVAEQQGESFERGIQIATDALLCSPNFLFRVEIDPKPNDKNSSRLLNDYELASRLSYFLWSSMPDDPLFALAGKGALHRPEVLAAQARRMLKDPKARALGDNFAGQWLQLRNLANVSPDTARYTDFNDKLRKSMKTETEMFFEAVVHEDRSILDFLDGKFTYLNGPLAKLYGIEGVEGDDFRRVNLTGDQRGGILTQASILTVTSNPTRSSERRRPRRRRTCRSWRTISMSRSRARCGSGWSSTGRTRSALRATRRWMRSASGWRTSTRSAGGVRRTATQSSTHLVRCRAD